MEIGPTIKQARKRRQMTQRELADKLGVTTQTVSNWERERTTPNWNELQVLARTLLNGPLLHVAEVALQAAVAELGAAEGEEEARG